MNPSSTESYYLTSHGFLTKNHNCVNSIKPFQFPQGFDELISTQIDAVAKALLLNSSFGFPSQNLENMLSVESRRTSFSRQECSNYILFKIEIYSLYFRKGIQLLSYDAINGYMTSFYFNFDLKQLFEILPIEDSPMIRSEKKKTSFANLFSGNETTNESFLDLQIDSNKASRTNTYESKIDSPNSFSKSPTNPYYSRTHTDLKALDNSSKVIKTMPHIHNHSFGETHEFESTQRKFSQIPENSKEHSSNESFKNSPSDNLFQSTSHNKKKHHIVEFKTDIFKGKITCLIQAKEYGFIAHEMGKSDIFFSYSDINDENLKRMVLSNKAKNLKVMFRKMRYTTDDKPLERTKAAEVKLC